MRGHDEQQGRTFSYVGLEDRVPQSHPLRPIRAMLEEVLAPMSGRFDRLYADTGRLIGVSSGVFALAAK